MDQIYTFIGMDEFGNEIARVVYESDYYPAFKRIAEMLSLDDVSYVEVHPGKEEVV